MSETNEERLARLTALIDDGWCPCRSSAGDARWLAERVAAVTRQRDEAQADNEALKAETERLRADNEAVLTMVAAQRDKLTETALADAQERLTAMREELERLREIVGQSIITHSALEAERDRLRGVIASSAENVTAIEGVIRGIECVEPWTDVALAILVDQQARAGMDWRHPTEVERKASAFDQARRTFWEFCDEADGKDALRCLGELFGEWEHQADRRKGRDHARGYAIARNEQDLEAAEVNRGQGDRQGVAQPSGAAAAPTGQAGGEQSGSAGPPAGSDDDEGWLDPDDRYPGESPDGEFPYSNPDLCRACGGMILPENRRIADGCACNSPRGVNHGLVPKNTCTCKVCDPEQTGSTRIGRAKLERLPSEREQLASALREVDGLCGVIASSAEKAHRRGLELLERHLGPAMKADFERHVQGCEVCRASAGPEGVCRVARYWVEALGLAKESSKEAPAAPAGGPGVGAPGPDAPGPMFMIGTPLAPKAAYALKVIGGSPPTELLRVPMGANPADLRALGFPDVATAMERGPTPPPPPPPIPILLWCPVCQDRHVDSGEFATRPHHTHACQCCGHVWRPAIVPTVGVQFLPGFQDEPAAGEVAPSKPEPTVPRGHCNRCHRCGWLLASAALFGCRPHDCSMRPLPDPREQCAGCGLAYDNAHPGGARPAAAPEAGG